MSSIRCSRASTAVLCVLFLLVTAGTATAFDLTVDGAPDSAEVGEEVSVTYTIEDPFTDVPDEWTLEATTELENVSWTVTVLQAGSRERQETYGDQEIEERFALDQEGADEIRIEIVGDAPAVENFSYDPPQEFTIASLNRVTGSNTQEFEHTTAHHYTADSDDARQAIDDAGDAIEAAGGHEEAESLRQSAISTYENGNFDTARDLANQAEDKANSASQSRQRRSTILVVVVALLVIGAIGGGVYYWNSQRDDYGKL